jgi:glutamate-1-semialdehyde aminotransferase
MGILRRICSAVMGTPAPVPHMEPLHDWSANPFLHPSEATHGYAGHLVDKQGRDYIDLSSAWGANILGYGYPRVAEAICAQALRFAGVGVPYPEFWQLADLLRRVIPCAEVVRYGKNGSDATMGAVRLARAITGREKVLHRGYHGFHDWWMAGTDCKGIPAALRGLIAPLPEFTPEAIEAAFQGEPERIACLIIDPMIPPIPEAAVVRQAMEIVHHHGALMIFDEVVSGFRVAPGGMQQVWGVTPDLACVGKCMANGMPLSALVGREEHMRHIGSVNYGMTFEGEAVSIAAALATINEILERDVCGELARKGQFLKGEYARIAKEFGVETSITGPDARPHLWFAGQNDIPERELRWLLIQEMAHENIITFGTFNLCFSHGEEDLQKIVSGFERGMHRIHDALEHGSVRGLLDERIHRSMGTI